MHDGYDALNDGAHDRALAIADQLRSHRHTSGFEIGARALREMGRLDEAVELLREGVTKAPGLAVLWHYLGCYESDRGHFHLAIEALQRAKQCPDADLALELYNIAVVQERMDDAAGALKTAYEAEGVANVGLPLHVLKELQSRLLLQTREFARALSAADEGLELYHGHVGDDPEAEDGAAYSRLLARRASALLELGRRQEALEVATDAVLVAPTSKPAADVLRRAEALTSPAARLFRVLIEGAWFEPLEDRDAEGTPPGFFVKYEIVADSVDEAMRFVRRFEPHAVHRSLTVSEYEELEPRAGEAKGIVYRSGYFFFPGGNQSGNDDDDEDNDDDGDENESKRH
jgi:tetratricopeptide (TPR) repeat protein